MSIPVPKLPKGRFVKVVQDPNGGFKIVTSFLGSVVGPRMDKGRATYPEGRSSRLSFTEAMAAFQVWESFCEEQEKEKIHAASRKAFAGSDEQGATLFDGVKEEIA